MQKSKGYWIQRFCLSQEHISQDFLSKYPNLKFKFLLIYNSLFIIQTKIKLYLLDKLIKIFLYYNLLSYNLNSSIKKYNLIFSP